MRIDQLSSDYVPAGRVVGWLPRATALEAITTAAPDSRPPTYDQLQHLRQAALPREEDSVAAPWLGFTCRLPDADRTTVAEMLRRYVDRHEALRSAFVAVDGGRAFERRTIDVGIMAFEPHELGAGGTPEAAHELVAQHLAAGTHPLRWPPYTFATVEHDDGTTVFGGFDHLCYDGYSAYLSVAELTLLHQQATGQATVIPDVDSYVDFAVTERDRCAGAAGRRDCLDPWEAALDEHRRLPGLPAATGVGRGERHEHTFQSVPIASAEATDGFISGLRTSGFPVGLGFTALLAQAILRLESVDRLDALMSTHNRATPEQATAVGWFAGVVPVTIDPGPAAQLADVTAATTAAWGRAQPAGNLPMPLVAELLEATLEPSLVLSYMNGRRCPGWEGWATNGARTLLGPVPPGAQVHAWISALPDATYLEVRYPDTPTCNDWVDAVANHMRTELLDAATAFASPKEHNPCR